MVEDEYNEDALEKLATGTGVEKDEHSNRALGGYKATLNSSEITFAWLGNNIDIVCFGRSEYLEAGEATC